MCANGQKIGTKIISIKKEAYKVLLREKKGKKPVGPILHITKKSAKIADASELGK